MSKWIFLVITLLSQLKIEAQISDFKNINFKNADKIADTYKGNDLSNLPRLAYNLTHNLSTDVEKFRAIHTWVCTNIENDYDGFRKNSAKRSKHQNDTVAQVKWNEIFSHNVFKKLAKEKRTVCTGYAYLVKTLANLANINCQTIGGFGRNESSTASKLQFPNHSWNAVQLNNKWYLCDATWSSGTYNLSTYTFEFNYNDGYFLADPELFVKDHFPSNELWLLLDEKQSLSNFFKTPLVYGAAYKYAVFPIEPSLMNIEIQKNNEVNFNFKDLKELNITSFFLRIDNGSSSQFIKPKIERLKNGTIQVKYTFTSTGTYDVHATIGVQPICTYVVKVKKQN